MKKRNLLSIVREFVHRLLVAVSAVALTLTFFLVLPLMQSISKPPATDLMVTSVDTANIPPPPPPLEEEPEKEPEPEDKPPELAETSVPLDLSQLEVVLNPGGFGDGVIGGDFSVKLNTVAASAAGDVDALFSMADLDQKPRVIYQPSPVLDAKVRKAAPGTVYVIFVVDQRGRVENAIVQSATDPIFEPPALAAVKQWKFEPGKRNGQPVRFRMRVPITFPKAQ